MFWWPSWRAAGLDGWKVKNAHRGEMLPQDSGAGLRVASLHM